MKKLLVLLTLFLILFFLTSCQKQKQYNQIDIALAKYLYVWNGGNLDSLDVITSENFQLRINPKFEARTGRDRLKENVVKTRYAFPDFTVMKKEIVMLSDTALALTWNISGTHMNPQDSSNYGKKTEAEGFSIIFYNEGILTGEWIGYSDLTWYKNLGYELVMLKKK